MSVLVVLIVFAVIFLSELPDKTALASLILGTRYRASLVFIGMAAAFACHVVLAVAAGGLLHLLPHRPLEGVVSALFLIGAVLLLRGRDEDDEEHQIAEAELSPLRVVSTSFGVILVAEFGDLTQIVTANLAAKYHNPIAVGIGALLALWSVGGLAILGGSKLLSRVPLTIVTRVAAAIMLVLAGFSLYQAIHG